MICTSLPRLEMKEEPLDIKSEVQENNENVLNSDAKILDFVKDIVFSDDIKPKFEVKEEKSTTKSSNIYPIPNKVDPIIPNDKEVMDFVNDIQFSDDMKPELEIKKEPLDDKNEVSENKKKSSVMCNNTKIWDFVKDIEFSDDIKPKFEVKEGILKVESSEIDQTFNMVDPTMSNVEEIMDFVHNIEFSNDIEPKLEIKEEPMDMEKSTEQPTRNLKIVDYFSIQNEVQWLRNIAARKAKLDKVQLKSFKLSACDNNEAKNISLLYNLPEVVNDYEKSNTIYYRDSSNRTVFGTRKKLS